MVWNVARHSVHTKFMSVDVWSCQCRNLKRKFFVHSVYCKAIFSRVFVAAAVRWKLMILLMINCFQWEYRTPEPQWPPSHQVRCWTFPFWTVQTIFTILVFAIMFVFCAVLITFRVSRRRFEMYVGHARLSACVRLCVCLSLTAFPCTTAWTRM